MPTASCGSREFTLLEFVFVTCSHSMHRVLHFLLILPPSLCLRSNGAPCPLDLDKSIREKRLDRTNITLTVLCIILLYVCFLICICVYRSVVECRSQVVPFSCTNFIYVNYSPVISTKANNRA